MSVGITPAILAAAQGGGIDVAFAPLMTTLALQKGSGSATFTRASSGTVPDASWNWQSMASNIHRLWGGTWSGSSWSATGVTSTSKLGVTWFNQNGFGLLLEPSRTNTILYGRALTTWGKAADVTLTNNQTGIDGAANAATLYSAGGTAGWSTAYKISSQPSNTFSSSAFCKKDPAPGGFLCKSDGATGGVRMGYNPVDGSTHLITNWTGVDYGSTQHGDWFRPFVVFTDSNAIYVMHVALGNTPWNLTYTFTGPINVVTDANQLEVGYAPTCPIYTTSAAVTRAAETLKWPATNNLNATSGVLIVDTELPFLKDTSLLSSGTMGLVSLTASAASLCYYDFSAQAFKATDGTNTASVAAVPARGKRYRIAVRWDTTANQLQIGCKNITDSGPWSWGTVTAFAGSFAGSDGNITLGVGIPESILIPNMMILRKIQSTSTIQGIFT
ncbi:MAG: hypothetical protein HQL66_03325 [Magnetococcales bacterium]|nr:hypothetical protein [Magnetococcales bacterium]